MGLFRNRNAQQIVTNGLMINHAQIQRIKETNIIFIEGMGDSEGML